VYLRREEDMVLARRWVRPLPTRMEKKIFPVEIRVEERNGSVAAKNIVVPKADVLVVVFTDRA
jgi:hypothetical protein